MYIYTEQAASCFDFFCNAFIFSESLFYTIPFWLKHYIVCTKEFRKAYFVEKLFEVSFAVCTLAYVHLFHPFP
jgi:hypothetical protein